MVGLEVMQTTRAPSMFACCSAKIATAPLPTISTVSPRVAGTGVVSATHATRPAHVSVAASRSVRWTGTCTTESSSTTANVASMPSRLAPYWSTTWAVSCGPATHRTK